jgi:nucleoside-diphosphate-sugar epimerase
MDDMVRAYLHCLEQGEKVQGVYNVSYGNVSVENVARRIAERIPCQVEMKPTNDPRSYRVNSDKLTATGFAYSKTLEHAVDEMRAAWEQGLFKDEDKAYSLRWMKRILGEQGN